LFPGGLVNLNGIVKLRIQPIRLELPLFEWCWQFCSTWIRRSVGRLSEAGIEWKL